MLLGLYSNTRPTKKVSVPTVGDLRQMTLRIHLDYVSLVWKMTGELWKASNKNNRMMVNSANGLKVESLVVKKNYK